MEALRIQSAMLRRSQMWHVTSFCRYTIVRHQSTFTSKTSKAFGSKLSSRSTLKSPGLQALSVQLHQRIQARTLQTTTQSSVDGPWSFPADAKSAEVAGLLASFREQVESSSKSNIKRRQFAAQEQLGKRAFEWMKQLEALDQQLAISKEFCKDLCWFLLAEGEESALVNFLLREAASLSNIPRHRLRKLYHGEDVTGYRLRRINHLLARLLEAHILLSTDGTANDALRCLSALNDAADGKGIFYGFEWAEACTCLQRHLTEDHCQPYDEQSLNALVKVMRKTTTPKVCERNLAYLMLVHPTSPDAFRALEMIKDELKERYVYKKGQRAVNKLGRTLFKTMFILDLQGATSEAQWARDTLRKSFRSVWANNDLIVASLRKDPKLQHLLKRSSAGAAEDDHIRSVAGDLLSYKAKG